MEMETEKTLTIPPGKWTPHYLRKNWYVHIDRAGEETGWQVRCTTMGVKEVCAINLKYPSWNGEPAKIVLSINAVFP